MSEFEVDPGPGGPNRCCGRHPWTHRTPQEARELFRPYRFDLTCKVCGLTVVQKDPSPYIRAAGLAVETTLPGAHVCCGRSVLTHLTVAEARLRPEGVSELCRWCNLTGSLRREVPVFEEWFVRAIHRIRRRHPSVPKSVGSAADGPRNREEFDTIVRTRVRFARKRLGLTQREMALELGIDRYHFMSFETGRRHKRQNVGTPTVRLRAYDLYRISRLLGCSLYWLCGDSDDPEWFDPDLSPMLGFEEYVRRETEAAGNGKKPDAPAAHRRHPR